MRISEIFTEASGPGDFKTFHDRGMAALRQRHKKNNTGYEPNEEAPAFRVSVKGNSNLFSELVSYEDDLPKDIVEDDAKERYLMRLKSNPRNTSNPTIQRLSERDLVIKPVYDNTPRLDQDEDGNYSVSPKVAPTDTEKILATEVSGSTVNTILNEIQQEVGDSPKYPYYERFITKLTEPGQGFKPFILAGNIKKYKEAGFTGSDNNPYGELVNEFGEIAGPVGLLSGRVNGSMARLLPAFFKDASGKTPTTEDFKSKAEIFFPPSSGHPLVDSFVKMNGRVLRISSKAGKMQMSGGSGAGLVGIYQSIAEIQTNPSATKELNTLLQRPEYRTAFETIRILAKEFDATESENNVGGVINYLRLLNEITNSTVATDSDIAILQNIRSSVNTDEQMHTKKEYIGAALGYPRDIRALQSRGESIPQFSEEFKNILKSFNTNTYGEPSTEYGREKLTGVDSEKRGWWNRLQKAIIYQVAIRINQPQNKLSELCAWILNHGSFCQIDTRFNLQDEKLYLYNITATWPSTYVERVDIIPEALGSMFRFKLLINSDRDYTEADYRRELNRTDTSLDDNLELEREAYNDARTSGKSDLARRGEHWAEDLINNLQNPDNPGEQTGKPEDPDEGVRQNESSNATLLIGQLFKRLYEIGAVSGGIPRVYQPVEKKIEFTENLADQIIRGEKQEYVEAIKVAVDSVSRGLWFFGDEYNDSNISTQVKAAKTITNVLSNALEANNEAYKAKVSGTNLESSPEYNEAKNALVSFNDRFSDSFNELESNYTNLRQPTEYTPATKQRRPDEPDSADNQDDEEEFTTTKKYIPREGTILRQIYDTLYNSDRGETAESIAASIGKDPAVVRASIKSFITRYNATVKIDHDEYPPRFKIFDAEDVIDSDIWEDITEEDLKAESLENRIITILSDNPRGISLNELERLTGTNQVSKYLVSIDAKFKGDRTTGYDLLRNTNTDNVKIGKDTQQNREKGWILAVLPKKYDELKQLATEFSNIFKTKNQLTLSVGDFYKILLDNISESDTPLDNDSRNRVKDTYSDKPYSNSRISYMYNQDVYSEQPNNITSAIIDYSNIIPIITSVEILMTIVKTNSERLASNYETRLIKVLKNQIRLDRTFPEIYNKLVNWSNKYIRKKFPEQNTNKDSEEPVKNTNPNMGGARFTFDKNIGKPIADAYTKKPNRITTVRTNVLNTQNSVSDAFNRIPKENQEKAYQELLSFIKAPNNPRNTKTWQNVIDWINQTYLNNSVSESHIPYSKDKYNTPTTVKELLMKSAEFMQRTPKSTVTESVETTPPGFDPFKAVPRSQPQPKPVRTSITEALLEIEAKYEDCIMARIMEDAEADRMLKQMVKPVKTTAPTKPTPPNPYDKVDYRSPFKKERELQPHHHGQNQKKEVEPDDIFKPETPKKEVKKPKKHYLSAQPFKDVAGVMGHDLYSVSDYEYHYASMKSNITSDQLLEPRSDDEPVMLNRILRRVIQNLGTEMNRTQEFRDFLGQSHETFWHGGSIHAVILNDKTGQIFFFVADPGADFSLLTSGGFVSVQKRVPHGLTERGLTLQQERLLDRLKTLGDQYVKAGKKTIETGYKRGYGEAIEARRQLLNALGLGEGYVPPLDRDPRDIEAEREHQQRKAQKANKEHSKERSKEPITKASATA